MVNRAVKHCCSSQRLGRVSPGLKLKKQGPTGGSAQCGIRIDHVLTPTFTPRSRKLKARSALVRRLVVPSFDAALGVPRVSQEVVNVLGKGGAGLARMTQPDPRACGATWDEAPSPQRGRGEQRTLVPGLEGVRTLKVKFHQVRSPSARARGTRRRG